MIHGSCLCGVVSYEITQPLGHVHHCHCAICRKAHAAAFSTYAEVPRAAFRFTAGEEQVRRYRSSPPCERTFCGACGANLQFLFEGMPESVWISLGTMDDDPGVRPSGHMFARSKAVWHDIADDLPRWDEYPPS